MISERNSSKKSNESLYHEDDKHIGTRYTSLGHYFCQLTFTAADKPVSENKADYKNLSTLFAQLTDEQLYEMTRTIKFNVSYAKHDVDYHSNSDEEEVHAILLTNSDLEQWATTYPGLRFNRVQIIAHSRSKLTGPPLPERVFNKILVKLTIPATPNPIELN